MTTSGDFGEGGGPHSGCHFMPGVLAVRPFEVDSAVAALGEQGVDAGDVTADLLGEFVDEGVVQGPGEGPVGLLSISIDPHEAAELLTHRDDPIQASPVHGVGYESHGKYMSGEGPTRVSGGSLPEPDLIDPEGWIAVVDSGLVDEESRPEWMRRDHVRDFSATSESIDEDGASHGTFVTSIVRMVAPRFGVAFAAAPPDRASRLTSRTPGDVTNPPTSELDVLGAISRLVIGLPDVAPSVIALNLSLGAPRCGLNDGFLLTLRSAIRLWRRHFGANAPIFAAGGNGDEADPVYPAAFDCVRGVGAGIDGEDEQLVWDDNGDPVVARGRYWVDDVAPGLDLLGAGGLGETDVVKWSGSSFASATAAALHANRAPFVVHNGVVFWQHRPMDYSKVPGLVT